MTRERVNGFLAVASPLTRSQRTLLAELSLKHRLAGMFGTRENVKAGGLMSYATDLLELTRRELVISLKTAKALGLTIPPSLLLRADHVIE
jgi:putative ABC transport system substrate-binding protein